MKFSILLCLLISGANVFAQDNAKRGSAGTKIGYIRSSSPGSGSDAVIVGEVPLAHTKQFLPFNAQGVIPAGSGLKDQVDQLFINIISALKPGGSAIGDIVKANVYLKNDGLADEARKLIAAKFPVKRQPAISFVSGELTSPGALLSIDVIAVSNADIRGKVSLSESADRYGQADFAILPRGPVVYVSGQAAKGGLPEATRGTLNQLRETLVFLGLDKEDIVQIKSFLNPMSDLDQVKKEFSDFFADGKIPPLVFVDWISPDPLIEIELIAASPVIHGRDAAQIEYITPPGMSASPVYAKVVRLNRGKKVYVSGVNGQKGGSEDREVRGVFDTMGKTLVRTGSGFQQLVKATYYIGADAYSKSLNDLRPVYYDPARPPAASKAKVKGPGSNRAGISIDMIGTMGVEH